MLRLEVFGVDAFRPIGVFSMESETLILFGFISIIWGGLLIYVKN